MKLIHGLILFTFIFLTSCQDGSKINLNLADAPEQEVYLELFDLDSFQILDTASLKNGKLSFEVNENYPNLYRIRFGLGKYIFISLVDGDHNLKIKGDWKDFDRINFSGSPSTEDINVFLRNTRVFASEQNGYLMAIDQLKAKGGAANDSMAQDAQKKYATNQAEFEKELEDYINNSKYLLNKLFAMNLLNADLKEDFITSQLSKMKKEYPNNPDLDRSIVKLAPQLLKSGSTQEEKAPEINGIRPNGKDIKLSDFRGKYVLVDFWASWCPPCRKENPHLVRVFTEFKDQNFTIFGVSLDKNKEDWQKAIHEDHLDWPQSSELKGWQAISVRDYNVQAIPANYLLDTEGNIIARDLTSEGLEAELSKIFNTSTAEASN